MSYMCLEEYDLMGDSQYRAYISKVEKALRGFERTTEWADLISHLGSLNKILQSNVKFPVIPKRVTIGKRLAQCLHPALPSGVHLKALETYDIIFKCIGTARLAADLFTWSSGLFPLLGYSAMNVKWPLLALYETHFVPLAHHVRPGLSGLLLGLLPGLEEASEHYDRTCSLLDDFSDAVEPTFFYGCLWECVRVSSTVRLQAINYLLSRYNKKQSMEDQLHFVGTDIDVMVDALCEAVQDASVLVQRAALEFLLIAFPLHNSQLTRPDMARLVTSSLSVVLRRDMSLNRRLYAWCLGVDSSGTPLYTNVPLCQDNVSHASLDRTDSQGDTLSLTDDIDLVYFNTYARELLVQAVQRIIRSGAGQEVTSSDRVSSLRPFRILISLLDKPEVGGAIIEDVLLDVFRCLHKECLKLGMGQYTTPDLRVRQDSVSSQSSNLGDRQAPKKDKNQDQVDIANSEIIKTANLLFGSFEPYFIWDFLARCFEDICRNRHGNKPPSASRCDLEPLEFCKLTEFLLDKVSLETYMETQTVHLPELLLRVTSQTCGHLAVFSDRELHALLTLCERLVGRVLPSTATAVEMPEVGDNLRRMRVSSTDTEEERPQGDGVLRSPSEDSFGDFVRFRPDPAAHLTLMQRCVLAFTALHETFVGQRVLGDPDIGAVMMSHLQLQADLQHVTSPPENSTLKISTFDALRAAQLGSAPRAARDVTVEGCHVTDDLRLAFTCACRLAQDYSSFPMYRLAAQPSQRAEGDAALPKWLTQTITCACFLDSFTLQCVAIQSLLDLMSLTKSNAAIVADAPSGDKKGNTVSVVIEPLLTQKHMRHMDERTCFYTVVAGSLWRALSESTPQSHRRAAELLARLHALAPSPWVCEDVMAADLLSEDKNTRVEASKRFSVLWHLLRAPSQGPQDGANRTFDRALFLMVDNLQSEASPCRVLAQTWLTHCIQRADLARLLEPILLILLHPDTARVSIQHVNITSPARLRVTSSGSSRDDGPQDTRIYAISSEGGNVIYHVANQRQRSPAKRAGEEARTFALTSVADRGSHTEAVDAQLETDLHFEKVNAAEVNLRMNPFGSEMSLDEGEPVVILKRVADQQTTKSDEQKNISGAKRLNAETCRQEGIDFENGVDFRDDDEALERHLAEREQTLMMDVLEQSEVDHVTAQVAGLLRELVEQVVSQVDDQSSDEVSDDVHAVHGYGKAKKVTIADEMSPNGRFDESNTASSPEVCKSASAETTESTTPVAKQDASALWYVEDFLSTEKTSDADTDTEAETFNQKTKNKVPSEAPSIHPLHAHLLLYTQLFDSERALYALGCVRALLLSSPRLITCAMATQSLGGATTPHLAHLQDLLARHRRSVFGKNFFSDLPSDAASTYRSSMYIEIVISICLYYMRSYYPNLLMSKLTDRDLNGNKQVQILSCDIMACLLSELIAVARDSGKGFSTYLSDLLNRCKVQKALLHCVLASVYNARRRQPVGDVTTVTHVTDMIIHFNEENMDQNTNEMFQVKLLRLLLVVIVLEDQIRQSQGDLDPEGERARPRGLQTTVRYVSGRPVVHQDMTLTAVLSALKQQHVAHTHRHWVAMVTAALPYMGQALSQTVQSVVNQLCRNIELLSTYYELGDSYQSGPHQPARMPPDHAVMVLEGLTTLCHYCLLESAQQDVRVAQGAGQGVGSGHISLDSTSQGVLNNLKHVFSSTSVSKEPSVERETLPPVMEAKRHLLSILPRILACLCVLWKSLRASETRQQSTGKPQPSWTLGSPKVVRACVMEFLSPLSVHHGSNLLAAAAVVWNDRRQRAHHGSKKIGNDFMSYVYSLQQAAGPLATVIPAVCEDQLLLVDLINAVKVLPIDKLIQTVRDVIKAPPPTTNDLHKKRTPLEVSLLQLFYAVVQRTGAEALADSWPCLLGMIRDAQQLSLAPPATFLLLAILNEFVQRVPAFEDRKSQKELQEMAQRLMEACGAVAGASLEQTTWLGRQRAVKPGPQQDGEEEVLSTDQEDASPEHSPRGPVPANHNTDSLRAYSVQALVMLSEMVAGLMDMVYSSEEKEKVAPFLALLLYNVFPYLRNHSPHNLPSFRACSQLVASISSYQYTRRAWRKEVLDLLLDPTFFQTDDHCLHYWRTITDNLMTHDRTTFRDLLARVTVTPGGMNLFSSRDLEFEQKAQLLKRLSFTIFCSELDQYHRFMPEIQERLSDCLRLPQVPGVQAQVFLCFRVILLRMSPQHLTSLWPTIITELVQILLQVEQALIPEHTEDGRSSNHLNDVRRTRPRRADPAWGTNGRSALSPGWLALYLSACKLLDLALTADPQELPQFQLYRWAFTGDTGREATTSALTEQPKFLPHVYRIAALMENTYGGQSLRMRVPGRPYLDVSHIRGLQDLQGFFDSLAHEAGSSRPVTSHIPKSASAPDMGAAELVRGQVHHHGKHMTSQQAIEELLHTDFLEPMVRVT